MFLNALAVVVKETEHVLIIATKEAPLLLRPLFLTSVAAYKQINAKTTTALTGCAHKK